jgi:hypothetical protein
MILMYDKAGTNLRIIPGSCQGVALYVDGWYANWDQGVAQFPDAFHVSITVLGRPNTMVCDCERGDLTPGQAAAWAHAELNAGRTPTIYCSLSYYQAVAMACAAYGLRFGYGGPVEWWCAAYDASGAPYLAPGSVATQFSGGITAPFDISETNGVWPNPAQPLVATPPAAPVASCVGGALTPTGKGYWLAESTGGVVVHGDAKALGNPAHLNKPLVGIEGTPQGGYVLAAADGGVFPYNAPFEGSEGNLTLNKPVVDIISHDPGGYLLIAADGGIFQNGDALFAGSLGGKRLNAPIVGGAYAHHSDGYWMVGADGGVFNFGGAPFKGSVGNVHLNQPVVGMASTPTDQGYWLVAADGGVFNFGDARFWGSTGNIRLNAPVVDIMATPSGGGYILVAADGGIFNFGDASFEGAGLG